MPHHREPVTGTPVFQRAEDAEREAQVARRVEIAWQVRLWHLPGLSFVDYLATRGPKPVGWVEVVSRNYSLAQLDRMGGVALKRHTYRTLLALDAVPLSTSWRGAFMVYDLADRLYWVRIDRQCEARETVLTDPRGAPGDAAERVVLIRGLRRFP